MNHAKLMCMVGAACLGIAACGGSSSSSSSASASAGSSSSTTAPSLSSFKTAFAADQKQFRQLGARLAKSIAGAGSKTDATLATEFSALAASAKQQASKLAVLNPPDKYKPQVDKLAAAFNAVSSDLSAISSAAVKHDAAAAKAATEKLVGDAAAVKSSDSALSKPLGLAAPGT